MMVEGALVSVVIPVYNGERFIGGTLASALAQTYRPLEVVVVDDGSTDRTADIIEDVAARDSRVRFFRSKNSGPAAARNFGISQARGTLISMLDADDLWHPEKISRQVEKMNASPASVGLVYCWSVLIDENDSLIAPVGHIKPTHQGHVTAELAIVNFIETSSLPLIRRAYIEAVRGYDVALHPQGAEDWKMYLALSEICEFAVVPEYLVGYRQSRQSLSRDVSGMAGSLDLVIGWLTEKWPDLPEEIARNRAYQMDCYLAGRALINNQFIEALRYRARAYTARSGKLPDRSDFGFFARLVFRMIGLRPAMFRPSETLVTFQDFLTAREIKKGVG
jgi:glycosyltransferase involved in cell wall biosynthesis